MALLGFLAFGAAVSDVAFGDLTRDPVAVADLEAYVGALSHIGVIVMSASAGIAIFGSVVLAASTGSAHGDAIESARYLGYMGGLTALLAIDDALLVHDRLVPRLTPLPESSVYAVYALVVAYGLYRFRSLIRGPGVAWFVAALVCFAGSLVVDRAGDQDNASGLHFFLEDGFKFMGYICWVVFFVGATWHALRASRLEPDDRSAQP